MIVANPKSYLWFAVACSSAIAAITLAVYLVQPKSTGRSAATQAATVVPEGKVGLPLSEAVMQEGEIPFYQGATTGSSGCEYPEVNQCWIDLYTNDTVEQVIIYYRDVLVKQGWDIVRDIGWDNWHVWGLDLVRINSGGKLPPRRIVTVSAGAAIEGEPGRTSITLSWQRWPDPFNIPLYPDRENMEVRLEDQGNSCTRERTITYETSATAAEVYSYYEQIMPLHGWRITETNGNLSRHFGWDRGFPEPEPPLGGFSGVTVTVEPGSEIGQPTKVELQAIASAYMIQCLEQRGMITPSPKK